MKPNARTIVIWLFISSIGLVAFTPDASAERLRQSDLGSTLEQRCDFCWYPSPNEESSNRLPTYKQHRPRRPPDSRPQRYPKGRYKLVSDHKQTRLSTFRSRWRQAFQLLSTLQLSVVDGDTIRVGSQRIRLRGIDTPEMNEPEGPAAKQRLDQLLRSGSIRIVPRGQDVYDRLIADVYVDDQNVAEILRSEGFLKAR